MQLVPCRAAAPFFSTKLLPCSSCVLLVSVSSTAPSTPSACLRFAWARLTRCRLRGRADSGRCGRSASPGPLPFVGPETTDGHARLPDQKGRRNSRRCRRPASRYQPNAGCRGGETPSPLCPARVGIFDVLITPCLHQSSALSSLSPCGWTQVTHDYFSLPRRCHILSIESQALGLAPEHSTVRTISGDRYFLPNLFPFCIHCHHVIHHHSVLAPCWFPLQHSWHLSANCPRFFFTQLIVGLVDDAVAHVDGTARFNAVSMARFEHALLPSWAKC